MIEVTRECAPHAIGLRVPHIVGRVVDHGGRLPVTVCFGRRKNRPERLEDRPRRTVLVFRSSRNAVPFPAIAVLANQVFDVF